MRSRQLGSARSKREAEGEAVLRDAIAQVRAAHGPTSVLLEELVIAFGNVRRKAAELWAMEEAYDIAAARERPPSTALMRRAEGAFESSLGARDFGRQPSATTSLRSRMRKLSPSPRCANA